MLRLYNKALQKFGYKGIVTRCCASSIQETATENSQSFETVFSFPLIKYFSIFNRLKVYHFAGTAVAIPSCGVLEILKAVPPDTFISAGYLGITGGALLSLASIPATNIIGFLYISKDNSQIKIAAVDYWGRRTDKVVLADDWIPLTDMSPRTLDIIYLTPQLADGTKYKLFLKFGKVHNSHKMGEVLE